MQYYNSLSKGLLHTNTHTHNALLIIDKTASGSLAWDRLLLCLRYGHTHTNTHTHSSGAIHPCHALTYRQLLEPCQALCVL